jgi:hypothetical protein
MRPLENDRFPHFRQFLFKLLPGNTLHFAGDNFIGAPLQFGQTDRPAQQRQRFVQRIRQLHSLFRGQLDREFFDGGECHQGEILTKSVVDSSPCSLPYWVREWRKSSGGGHENFGEGYF